MDGILFEEWVRELDRKFLSEGRNVALVIDNYFFMHFLSRDDNNPRRVN